LQGGRVILRYGSALEQLQNDRFEETQGDAIERAYRCGHNSAVSRVIDSLWLDEIVDTSMVSERIGTDELRAYCRGRNAGMRHVRDVLRAEQEQRERAECEARDALAKSNPIEFCLQELVENTPAEAE
jgi:hypothetical protein